VSAADLARLGIAVVGVLLATGCANDWRTDMWFQAAIRPEQQPRPEPEHAVALGAGPRYQDRDETEKLANPLPPTPEALARGQAVFLSRCAPCHAKDGRGNGPVSKFFPPPPDLAYRTVVERSDGYLFGTVTLGGRAMPPQREGLTPGDRWAVVDFIRSVQDRAKP
jgi:mono/diheme cytochrome c family protein